jgi:Tfp pilus assembly protein PilW
MRRRQGYSLVQLVIAILVMTVLAGGILQMFSSLFKVNMMATNIPANQADAMAAINLVGAGIRKAPLCGAASGCVLDSAIHSATANAVTVYADAAGTQATYSVQSGALVKVQGSTTTTYVASGVTGFSIWYCVNPDGAYNSTNTPDTIGWSTSVTGNDLKKIVAVKLSATITRGSTNKTYSSVIRLRNSPKKTSAY